MIPVDPFVLEKAPLGWGLLLGILAMGGVGLWLWFGGRRRVPAASRDQARQRRFAGGGFVLLSVLVSVVVLTGGGRVTVSCEAGRLEIDQSGLAWPGARAFPVAQVREVAVGFAVPSSDDSEEPPAPEKVLWLILTNGERHVLSSGPWRDYGSDERAAVALNAALARCRPSPSADSN